MEASTTVWGAEMTKRLPCPPAPGPLEAYAVLFDDLFGTLAQRRVSRASRSRLDRVPESRSIPPQARIGPSGAAMPG